MNGKSRSTPSLILDRGLGVIGIILLGAHGIIAVSHHVNVPAWDLWEDYLPGRLDAPLHFKWLFLEQNEHRIVFTRFIEWILYRLGGLNYTVQIAVNFCIYLALCALVLGITRLVFKAQTGFLLLPLASGLLSEIHYSPIENHFHLYLIFFLTALCFAYRKDAWSWGAPIAAACSVYSFSAGVFCGFVVGLACLMMGYVLPVQRTRRSLQALGCFVAVCSFFYRYQRRGFELPFTYPSEGLYWRFLCSLVARGFGYDAIQHPAVGLIIVAGLATLMAIFWRNQSSEEGRRQLVFLVASLAGIMLVAASVAAGRAAVGEWPHNIFSRYLENMLLLVPLTWMLMQPIVAGRPRLQLVAAALLLIPFANEFSYRREYVQNRSDLLTARSCLAQYFAGLNDGYCPQSYPFNVAMRLTYAKVIGASFIDELVPPGSMERLGQFGRKATIGKCFIDEMKIAASGPADHHELFVRGWAFHDQVQESLPSKVSIQLSSQTGERYRFPARRAQRNDVNEAFALPAEREVGFTVDNSSIALLPAGTYDLFIEQSGDSEAYLCNPGHQMTVAPRKFSPFVTHDAS